MLFDGFEFSDFINIRFDSPLEVLKAIVEVLFLMYFIYLILNIFRRTRTWQLLKGVILIAVITVFANLLDLRTLAYLLNNTFGFLAIGVVIVFQPELRRGLEQIGRSGLKVFFNTGEDKPMQNMINAVVRASADMSATLTGALIVLERRTELGEIIDTGIPLGADVSSELLVNIFTKNTPLHDGAVVIRNIRIEAATCYLPLTEDMTVGRELGTRHRAAIGISEATDALVVVVSEETGSISYVENGIMRRDLREDALRGLLEGGMEEFMSPARGITFLRGRLKA